MSAYLARLKQLENVKNSHYAPDTFPPKPPKAPFDPFGGMGAGHIEKNIIADPEIIAPTEPSGIANPISLQAQQREGRRQKVIALLEAAPGTRYAVIVEDTVTDPVVVTVAIRGKSTFELEIQRHSYDGLALLELIEKHSLESCTDDSPLPAQAGTCAYQARLLACEHGTSIAAGTWALVDTKLGETWSPEKISG